MAITGQTCLSPFTGGIRGTSLTHIPSCYRIALLSGWLTARYAIPENKPSRTACAQMAIDRLVAQYGSLHQLDRLNCKPVINETADCAR